MKNIMEETIEGNIIDIECRRIYPGTIFISGGKITDIQPNEKKYDQYICPGFIDAHVHIESSMLTPYEFSRAAIKRGTTIIINDPHEIANVLGVPGIRFMLENSKKALIKMYFGIPSCVPATPYDSAGAAILASDIEELAKDKRFILLSEVMNVSGVINNDADVIEKLEIAKRHNLLIDGHAPLLKGEPLTKYIRAGISTDHECSTIEEAQEKISKGMKILIREGSAAKNYEALKSLIKTNPDDIMFCTDDSHPDELLNKGHIDKIVKKAIADGFDLFDVLRAACLNPLRHYKISDKILQKGANADFMTIRNTEDFETLSVYIDGIEKYKKEADTSFTHKHLTSDEYESLNNFVHTPISTNEIKKRVTKENRCIQIINNEIVTKKNIFHSNMVSDNFESDIEQDILKIVYINRYNNGKPQVAFMTGFTLKTGAIATSISHDSHNIIAVGTKDIDIVAAVNAIIANKGGMAIKERNSINILPLPIAGIMSDKSAEEVSMMYERLNSKLTDMGCTLSSPFMTLSFMSLIVIPELKIGEKGLFDFNTFSFLDL